MADPARAPSVAVGRSEMTMAADTIGALLAAHMIPMTPSKISEASLATGVPVAEIKRAWSRRDAGLYRPPTRYLCPTDPEPDEAQPVDKQLSRTAGPLGRRDEKSEPAQRNCTRCKTVKPVDEFAFRNRERGKRLTWCRSCHSDYQQARTLALDANMQLVITHLRVRRDDACCGDTCPTCTEPILEGDDAVAFIERVVHARCFDG